MGLKDKFSEYDDYEKSIANELRALRRQAGISIQEMSEKIGLHTNSIGKVERHEYGVGMDIVYGYAKVLNKPLTSFITKQEAMATTGRNPLSELSEEEMLTYSQMIVEICKVFSDRGIKLSGERSLDATRIVASAIIEQRR